MSCERHPRGRLVQARSARIVTPFFAAFAACAFHRCRSVGHAARLLAVVLALAIATAPVHAQGGNGQIEGVVVRKIRLFLGRTHVGEDKPGKFQRRVGALERPFLDLARRRLARRVQNSAIHVELPTVITAADAALSEPSSMATAAE